MSVKAKKHLGQHFLTDENIAKKITQGLREPMADTAYLEVGPGMGVLTKYLLDEFTPLFLAEIDKESIEYLLKSYPNLGQEVFIGDFLKTDFSFTNEKNIEVIGNFPYNISSQILFKIVDYHHKIPRMVGMFQKEVAERVSASPRTKDYGILSVLIQAYYDTEYLFTVHENVFSPPPKVKSGVIRLERNIKEGLIGSEDLFKKIVKAGFGQRRKKLSNALKILQIPEELKSHPFMDKRAEELSVEDFIAFTHLWKNPSPLP